MTAWKIHPSALDELHDAIRYYAETDPALAVAFEEAYLHHRQVLLANRLLYHVRSMSVRRANLVPRFKEYHIAYTIWHEKVLILAIAHGKRKPYYWQERIAQAKEKLG
jgi:plasmid stabilization system protein ParE